MSITKTTISKNGEVHTRVRRQYSATWLAARAARQVRRAAARRTA